MRSVIESKSKLELFKQFQLKEILHNINRDYRFIDEKNNVLTDVFFNYIINLKNKILGLYNVFSLIFNNSNILDFLDYILQIYIPEGFKSFDSIISREFRERVDLLHESEENIRILLQDQLDIYAESISSTSSFSKLVETIEVLNAIKYLVFFDYGFFDNREYVRNISLNKYEIIDSLEKLYFALYVASRYKVNKKNIDKFISVLYRYVVNKKGKLSSSNLDIDGSMINDIIINSRTALNTLPLLNLLQYIKKQNYYKAYIYPPRLDIRNYLHDKILRNNIRNIDLYLLSLKDHKIQYKLDELFNSKKYIKLNNYILWDHAFGISEVSLNEYSRVRTLTFIYNFLNHIYKGNIRSVLTSLHSYFPFEFHFNELRDRIDTIEDRIRQFDLNISIENVYGVSIETHWDMLKQSVLYRLSFNRFVDEKNKEAIKFIDLASLAISDLKDSFESLINAKSKPRKIVHKGELLDFDLLVRESLLIMYDTLELLNLFIDLDSY